MAVRFIIRYGHPTSQAVNWVCIADLRCLDFMGVLCGMIRYGHPTSQWVIALRILGLACALRIFKSVAF
jgi:hypothetical protein